MLALPSFSRLFVACFFLAVVVASPLAISKSESPDVAAVAYSTTENTNSFNETADITKRAGSYDSRRRKYWKEYLPIEVYIEEKEPTSNNWALIFDREYVVKAWRPSENDGYDENNRHLRGVSGPFYLDQYPEKDLIKPLMLYLSTGKKDPMPIFQEFWKVEVGEDEASYAKNVLEFCKTKKLLLAPDLSYFNKLYEQRIAAMPKIKGGQRWKRDSWYGMQEPDMNFFPNPSSAASRTLGLGASGLKP
ncbi:hypothetical protein GG344DRAFT_64968 [Lentinula edodes]|nr:hypothetical protein GG344DRAFT_64968 [Lentinula edodes]